jgi:hypothetical protein
LEITGRPESFRIPGRVLVSQVPINIGDARYDPLFKYGLGLSY